MLFKIFSCFIYLQLGTKPLKKGIIFYEQVISTLMVSIITVSFV